MLRGFLIFSLFVVIISSSTLFAFPEVVGQTNNQINDAFAGIFNLSNMQSDQGSDFSSSDMHPFELEETEAGATARSSDETDNTKSVRGLGDFYNSYDILTSTLWNYTTAPLRIMFYFDLPSPFIYTLGSILIFFQLIGMFFIFQIIVSTGAGVISFFIR